MKVGYREKIQMNDTNTLELVCEDIKTCFYRILNEYGLPHEWHKDGLRYGFFIQTDVSYKFPYTINIYLGCYRPTDESIKIAKITNYAVKSRTIWKTFDEICIEWADKYPVEIIEEGKTKIKNSINKLVTFSDQLNSLR